MGWAHELQEGEKERKVARGPTMLCWMGRYLAFHRRQGIKSVLPDAWFVPVGWLAGWQRFVSFRCCFALPPAGARAVGRGAALSFRAVAAGAGAAETSTDACVVSS